MDDYLPRAAEGILGRALEVSPVVVVTGARQTGKSTLVQRHEALAGRLYLTLDDPDVRAQAREDPDGLLHRADGLVLDEVQREPALLLALKRVVDAEGRVPGRFVLTGSAHLLLMSAVSDTLAGRATYLRLWPMTRRELLGHGAPGRWDVLFDRGFEDWVSAIEADGAGPDAWRTRATVGGYPVPAHELRDPDGRALWFRGYVDTYLERDLQDLSSIGNLIDFRRIMRLAALRVGGLENQADIARDGAVSHATAHRWLGLLETSFQLVRIEPYTVTRTKRLVKSRKLYWSDTGLALYLAAAEPDGAHLENLVLGDLLAWRDAQLRPPQVLYWRTRAGAEVDFVIERGDELVAIEVKATRRPGYDDTRHLRLFRDEYGARVRGGVLLHAGEETARLTDGVVAVPWWKVV